VIRPTSDRFYAALLQTRGRAGKDFTPVEAVEEFAGKVRDQGVDVRMQVYPEAPHSFFDRGFAEHAAACDDAWRQILEFTGVG